MYLTSLTGADQMLTDRTPKCKNFLFRTSAIALERFWFFVTNLSPKKQNRYNRFVLANLYYLTPSASPNFSVSSILFSLIYYFEHFQLKLFHQRDRFHHLLSRESPIADEFSTFLFTIVQPGLKNSTHRNFASKNCKFAAFVGLA